MGGGKKKKPFVNKKTATTFIVVNKSGSSHEVEPGRVVTEKVFMPVAPKNLKGKSWEPGLRLDANDGWSSEDSSGADRSDDPREAAADDAGGVAGEVGVRVANFRADDFELGEYGFPDDGYDYRQHFTAMGGGKYIPAAELGSVTQATRAAKAVPVKLEVLDTPPPAAFDFDAGVVTVVKDEHQVVVRPQVQDTEEDEVMRLLEQSSDEAEELLDTFVADAMEVEPVAAAVPKASRVRFADAQFGDDSGEDSSFEGGEEDGSSEGDSDEDFDPRRERLGPVVQFEERSAGTVVDGWLDHMMEKEYDDDLIGEGAEEDAYSTSRHRPSTHANDLAHLMDQFLEQRSVPSHAAYHEPSELDAEERRKTLELAQRALSGKDDAEVDVIEVVERDDQWDCQSILSTYSNVANHPQVLLDDDGSAPARKKAPKGPKVSFVDQTAAASSTARRPGEPLEEDGDELAGDEDSADGEPVKAVNKGAARSKKETPEERKARKAAVKAERRVHRQQKKATKLAFKEEEKSQITASKADPFFQRTVISMKDQ